MGAVAGRASCCAYGLSEGGADWRTVHVRDIASGKDLPDEVRWMRFSNISWTKDSKGFFYSRYPEPPKNKVLEAALSGQRIYYHRVGTPQSQDRSIYERKDLPPGSSTRIVTEDGRYLLITMAEGAENNNRLYYADLGDPKAPSIDAPVKPLIEDDDAEYAPIGNSGSTLYRAVRSRTRPTAKSLAIDLAQSGAGRVEDDRSRAQGSDRERRARSAAGIVAQYLVDVQSRSALFDLDGSAARRDRAAGHRHGRRHQRTPGSPDDLVQLQLAAAAVDGLRVRSVASQSSAVRSGDAASRHRRLRDEGAVRDVEGRHARAVLPDARRRTCRSTAATRRCCTDTAGFRSARCRPIASDVPAWLERGGIWVTANMRGGAEYGEAWHKAGMLEKKQNVFDDFIAVAEYLVKEKYTSPAQARHHGRLERRAAGRRGDGAAAGSVRRRAARRSA